MRTRERPPPYRGRSGSRNNSPGYGGNPFQPPPFRGQGGGTGGGGHLHGGSGSGGGQPLGDPGFPAFNDQPVDPYQGGDTPLMSDAGLGNGFANWIHNKFNPMAGRGPFGSGLPGGIFGPLDPIPPPTTSPPPKDPPLPTKTRPWHNPWTGETILIPDRPSSDLPPSVAEPQMPGGAKPGSGIPPGMTPDEWFEKYHNMNNKSGPAAGSGESKPAAGWQSLPSNGKGLPLEKPPQLPKPPQPAIYDDPGSVGGVGYQGPPLGEPQLYPPEIPPRGLPGGNGPDPIVGPNSRPGGPQRPFNPPKQRPSTTIPGRDLGSNQLLGGYVNPGHVMQGYGIIDSLFGNFVDWAGHLSDPEPYMGPPPRPDPPPDLGPVPDFGPGKDKPPQLPGTGIPTHDDPGSQPATNPSFDPHGDGGTWGAGSFEADPPASGLARGTLNQGGVQHHPPPPDLVWKGPGTQNHQLPPDLVWKGPGVQTNPHLQRPPLEWKGAGDSPPPDGVPDFGGSDLLGGTLPPGSQQVPNEVSTWPGYGSPIRRPARRPPPFMGGGAGYDGVPAYSGFSGFGGGGGGQGVLSSGTGPVTPNT